MTQSWLWGSQIAVKKKKKEKEKARQLFDDEDVDNKHYTAIKNLSRLLTSLNATHKGHIFLFFFFFFFFFCVWMNCLNGFRTASARDDYYEYFSSKGHVKVIFSSKSYAQNVVEKQTLY